MNREKYAEVVTEEMGKVTDGNVKLADPENWPEGRRRLVNFIAEVDKAHEVFSLENTPEKES